MPAPSALERGMEPGVKDGHEGGIHSLRVGLAGTGLALGSTGQESMIWIPDGSFLMGSDQFYREERPAHRQTVAGFWIDPYPVTNAAFARFIRATSYVTLSERQPDPTLYRSADPSLLVPGSLVFRQPRGPVDLRDYRAWWEYVPGADWRHPEGPGSTLEGRDDYPVVHIGHEDACAYAAWMGKALPTEAEWEFASRGGLDGASYAWGVDAFPDGRFMANTWQGRFRGRT